MEGSMSSSDSKQSLSEMKIIILGCDEGGKSSSGNTILGKEAFPLKKISECIKKHGKVAGRHIIVIDTPGRKRDFYAPDTPKLLKDEVVRSVALCPPGPHALLLVNRAHCPFEPQAKQAVEKQLELFGDHVWNHIIVLFTHWDLMGDETIEEHIEDQGEPLQTILEKCGNRYHVFNNKETNGSQVYELLKKVEEMMEENKGHPFEMDKTVLNGLIVRRREEEERAKERRKLRIQPREIQFSRKDLRIVLLGCQCSGKSTAGNTILGENVFRFRPILTSEKKQATVAGTQVTVIDTPGWSNDDCITDTPKKSTQEIVHSVSLCPPGPHAFLLVIPVDTTFTDADERSIIDHLGLFGEHIWNHTIVVFTCADWIGDTDIEMYIESEGEALQRVVDKCGNRYHALNNMDVDDKTQVRELLEKIEYNIKVNAGSHFEMDDSPEKGKYESWQEEVKCNKSKQRDVETEEISSSGYASGSVSMKSSNSKGREPPTMHVNME